MPIVIDNTVIANQQQNLKAAMTTDPKLRKVIQGHIREALYEARREMMGDFPGNDPRNSRKSIRTSVYEKILGGNINILTGKKTHSQQQYEPPRKGSVGRGGNRRLRSERTKQIMSYGPLDRGWILRIVNSGTKTRVIGFRNTVKGNLSRYNATVSRISRGDKVRTGNRGAIAPRNWFDVSSERALGKAAQSIAEMINIEAEAILNGDT